MNYLIIVGLTLYLLLAIFRRDLALYLLIILLPSFQIRFQIADIPMTFLEGMILVLSMVEGFYLWGKKQLGDFWQRHIWQSKLRNLIILLFLLASFTAIFASPVLVKAAGLYKAFFIEAILLYFVVLAIIDNQAKIQKLINALAILVLWVSGFGLYQFLTLDFLNFTWWAPEIASRRIASILVYPNALALLIGPIIALLIFLPKNKLRTLAIGTGIIALYWSFSRGAWLAMLVAIPLMGLLTPHRKKLILAGVIGALLILTLPTSRAKITTLARFSDPSQSGRSILWRAAIDMIKKDPLSGVGLAGFHEAYKNYPLGPDGIVHNYPHNIILNFWVEIGLAGLIAFIGLMVYFYKKVWYLLKTGSRQIALAAAAGMAMIILHGLVDAPYFKNDLSVVFWLVFSFVDFEIENRRS